MGEVNGHTSNRSRTIDHQSDHFGHCPRGQGEKIIGSRDGSQYDDYNRNSELNRNSDIRNTGNRSEYNLTTTTTRESQFSSLSTNASGNVYIDIGRGRHTRIATRADGYGITCIALAAQSVPVSKSRNEVDSNSAFDNKAFSNDGDVVDTHELQTQNNSQLKCNATLTQNNISEHSEQNCAQNLPFNEQLINNNICNDNNKSKNCLVKPQNETNSAFKRQQYCSQSDNNCHVISARNSRSARSSVVKHIGVFYSDLCDVIKAMRSGNNNNTNNNINNNNNITNNNNNQSVAQQSCVLNQSNHRNNIISAPVLLQNEHLMSATLPVQTQTQQHSPGITYSGSQLTAQQPMQCIQTSQLSHLSSGNTLIRSPSQSQTQLSENQVHDLPDILNSHLPPPPYSTLPPHQQLPPLSLPPLAPLRAPPPPPPPLISAAAESRRPPLPSRRILHAPTVPLSHCSRPNYLRPSCAVSETETSASKTCLSCNGVSIRWFILLIAFIGLLCAIIGTILGALRTTGREHLTLALLMIGVGIILITVSGIAWRLTSSGPSWRSILGLHELHQQQSLCNGSSINEASRRFVPRVPAPYGRTGTHHHPYGAMFYPEFQYRPPPPSYQASMQEYRLRLLLLDRSSSHPQSTSLSPVSPPPTYRSSAASSLTGTLTRQSHTNTIQRAPSRPPSYRAAGDGHQCVSTQPSYQSSTTQTVPQPLQTLHSPQASPLMTTSGASTGVSSTLTTSQSHSPHSNTFKTFSQNHNQTHHSSHHDINRVTILQTTNTSQVCTPNGVNIVAISPTTSVASNTITPNLSPNIVSNVNNEVQILAHV